MGLREYLVGGSLAGAVAFGAAIEVSGLPETPAAEYAYSQTDFANTGDVAVAFAILDVTPAGAGGTPHVFYTTTAL